MTTGSDIAFWKILNDKIDKVLSSRLDSPLARLLFVNGLRHPALLPLCCLFLVFVLICFKFLEFSQARSLKEDCVHTRIALQALMAVVVPTCSLWPGRYIKFASRLHSSVNIPLEVIIKDTISGVVELRNPSSDLAELIGSGATVNGHTIRINIGWKWWINCFEWWILAKCKSGLPDWLHHNVSIANSCPPDLSSSSFALASSTSCPVLCLDYLPHGIDPIVGVGCKVTLEFTAFSSSLRTLSTAQIISAVPFMVSKRPRHWPRSLASVLGQLNASYGPNMVIDSLSNVSVDYEHALHHVHKSFREEQKIRGAWIKILGIKAWRREMLLVALEAALVRRGWLERWAVQVSVK